MLTSRVGAAGALAVAVALALAVATPAQAHNYLVASTPAAGSTISEVPESFSVTTNEALLDLSGDGSGFAIEVTDSRRPVLRRRLCRDCRLDGLDGRITGRRGRLPDAVATGLE